MNVGIVGQGFVGTAVREGLKDYFQLFTYDINKSICNSESLEAVVNNSEIIFLCLPTPMKISTGECDTSILEKEILAIDALSKDRKIVVIKSTIPPGTSRKFSQFTKNIEVVFNPEFLTEANSINDFKNQNRIIVGGQLNSCEKVECMFKVVFPSVPVIKTSFEVAEMVKYFTNCFLAMKVTFANEMFEICNSAGIDYDEVILNSLYDERIGKSHLKVPGPDGDFGFGGHCFPKDVAALIHFSKINGLQAEVLNCVQNKNNSIRKNKDWLEMEGRAIMRDK